MQNPVIAKIARTHRRLLAGIVGAMTLVAGCVTEQIRHSPSLAESSLIVTRSGEEVTLHWQTEPGSLYTISYTDRRGQPGGWKLLPGWVNVPGTGALMMATDRVRADQDRRYQLGVRPAGKRSSR
jgi:hypothetical protein